MSDIGIIGHGIVGKAVEYGFKEGDNNIRWHDKLKKSASLESVVDSSEFIFVCLPTPFSASRERIDLSIMDENMAKITQIVQGTDKVIVIKSTVVPGTTRGYAQQYPKCRFCFNPEFLTEANYLQDFVATDRHVIGADDNHTRLMVIDLYKDRFPKTPIYPTDSTTAEMVKYMANCFLATKVIFGNEMYDLCEKLGIKYEEVKEMVVADQRIFDSHLNITSLRGFGGKCFPKDLVAMIGRSKELGVDTSLLETVWKKNLRIRKTRDWEDIPFAKSG